MPKRPEIAMERCDRRVKSGHLALQCYKAVMVSKSRYFGHLHSLQHFLCIINQGLPSLSQISDLTAAVQHMQYLVSVVYETVHRHNGH